MAQSSPDPVTFWFDFISPYSWLAFVRAEEFTQQHGITWRLRPIVFGVVLDRTGLVGPGEVVAKRNGAMRDVQIQAHDLGVDYVGPPAHPFLSLAALRTACLWQDDTAMCFRVSRAIFRAGWERGVDLTLIDNLQQVLADEDIDAPDLKDAIRDLAVKDLLRANTDEAIERGVYGVPSFEAAGELFWGQDRLDFLARKLRGELPEPGDHLTAMLARPIAEGRKQKPTTR